MISTTEAGQPGNADVNESVSAALALRALEKDGRASGVDDLAMRDRMDGGGRVEHNDRTSRQHYAAWVDACQTIRNKEAHVRELRGALQELRIRLHSHGRRPQECYEMSLIDEALRIEA